MHFLHDQRGEMYPHFVKSIYLFFKKMLALVLTVLSQLSSMRGHFMTDIFHAHFSSYEHYQVAWKGIGNDILHYNFRLQHDSIRH